MELQATGLSVPFLLSKLGVEAKQAGSMSTVAMPIVLDKAQELCWQGVKPRAERQAGANPAWSGTAYGLMSRVIHEHLVAPHPGQFVAVVCGSNFHVLHNEYAGGSGVAGTPGTGPVVHLLKSFPKFTTVAAFKNCVTSLGFGAIVDLVTNEMWQFAVDELQSRGRTIAVLLAELCKASPLPGVGAKSAAVAGAGAGATGGGEMRGGSARDDDGASSADSVMTRPAAGDGDAPPLNATTVNTVFKEAVIRARDVALRSPGFIRLARKFKDGVADVRRGVATDAARLHQALSQIAACAYLDASTRGKNLEFPVAWEDHDGERKLGESLGSELMTIGVGMPLNDDFATVHVCEPVMILGVLQIVPPQMIIDKVLASWRSVAFISSSVNAYIYKLVLCDCFKRLFAAKDVADIPGLNASRWAQKFPGRWRLPDEGVLCARVPSLDEWLHAAFHRDPANSFGLPHDNDDLDSVTLVAAQQSVASAVVADVAAAATPADAATAPSVSEAKGNAAAEGCRVLMLVQAKLGTKYRGVDFNNARGSVLRSTIGHVAKTATGRKRQRWEIEQVLKFPILGVVFDPSSSFLLDGALATSGHVEWDGQSDFVWIMDRQYFATHEGVATIFNHAMVLRLYLCIVEGGAAPLYSKRARL